MKKHPIFQRMTAVLAAAAMLGGYGSGFPGLEVHAAVTETQDFRLTDVTVTDAYCTNAFDKEMDYLLSFDTEKLLAGFRDNAGLPTNGATRYGGWENTNIGGHCIGHYLTALAQAYQHPDLTPEQKDALYSRMKKLIDEMQICQQHSRGKQGFLWAAPVPSDGNVERQFDMHRRKPSAPIWATGSTTDAANGASRRRIRFFPLNTAA